MSESLLGTTKLTQVALVVSDIEKTAAKYAEILGMEVPPITMTGDYSTAKTEFEGEPTEARCKLAFFKVGDNVNIELIEPDDTPSVWRNYLNEHGDGLHHIAFNVNGMKTVISNLVEKGMPLVQKAEYPGGRYAYVDASKDLKLIVELLEND